MKPFEVGLVLAVLFGLCEVIPRQAVIRVIERGGKCILQVTAGTPLNVVWEALWLHCGGPMAARIRDEVERGLLPVEWV